MRTQDKNKNTLRDFLLALHLINLKMKKPPDKSRTSYQADSADKVGDLKSR